MMWGVGGWEEMKEDGEGLYKIGGVVARREG